MEVTIKSNQFTSFGGIHPVTKVPFSVNLEGGTAVCDRDIALFLKGQYGVEIVEEPLKEEPEKIPDKEEETAEVDSFSLAAEESPEAETVKPKRRKRGDLDA